MGFLKKLTKLGLDVATTPIALAKDIFTLGGAIVDEDEPFTKEKITQLAEDWEELRESLDE